MALTESTMLALGSKASDFLLPDTRGGDKLSYAQVAGERGTAILFICNHCPYVIHVRDELLRIGRAYLPRGIGFAAVSSNDVSTHPTSLSLMPSGRSSTAGGWTHLRRVTAYP